MVLIPHMLFYRRGAFCWENWYTGRGETAALGEQIAAACRCWRWPSPSEAGGSGGRVRSAARRLWRQGVVRVLAPPGFSHWDLLTERGDAGG